MTTLPDHIVEQLNQLIDEGKSTKEIAFMMRLTRETVESAKRERRNTMTVAENSGG
jgi:DNA-binding NarL/FixJ family response regulator